MSTPNVLLVDDRQENLVALEAVLAPLDCRMVTATSGAGKSFMVRTSSGGRVMPSDRALPTMSATTAATCGEAIDVPSKKMSSQV